MSWVSTAERIDARERRSTRTLIRGMFNVSNHVPVIEGPVDKPILEGKSGGWYTKGGTRISHPSAYCKRGWSNMNYICSTLKIVVPLGTFKN